MTDTNDVTRTFTDGLKQIVDYIPKLVNKLGDGDKTFREQKDELTRYKPSFEGMGARAFALAVETNIKTGAGYHPMVDALSQNSSHLLTQITRSNDEANLKMSDTLKAARVESGQGLEHYGYSVWSTLTEMRDAALQSSDMNMVMDKGPGYFIGKLDAKKQDILNDIAAQHLRKMSQFQDPKGADADSEKLLYTLAQRGVEEVQSYLEDAITTWVKEITGLLDSYRQGILDNKVTVAGYTPPGLQYTKVTYSHLYGIPWLPLQKDTFTSGPTGSVGPSGDPGNLFTWDPQNGNFGIFADGKLVLYKKEEVIGNSTFGFTNGDEFDGPSGNVQLGFQNGSPSSESAGVSLGSASRSLGLNIAGANISATATASLSLQAGISLDKKGLEVKVPFSSFAVSFGQAK